MISAIEARRLTEQSIENIKNNQEKFIQSELNMINSMIKERCKNEESLFPKNEIDYKFDERLNQESREFIVLELLNNGFVVVSNEQKIMSGGRMVKSFANAKNPWVDNTITIKW